MRVRVFGRAGIDRDRCNRGTGGAGEAKSKAPGAGAGGAQFDLYDSMSENTRLGDAIKGVAAREFEGRRARIGDRFRR
jgi:hypothetical protein